MIYLVWCTLQVCLDNIWKGTLTDMWLFNDPSNSFCLTIILINKSTNGPNTTISLIYNYIFWNWRRTNQTAIFHGIFPGFGVKSHSQGCRFLGKTPGRLTPPSTSVWELETFAGRCYPHSEKPESRLEEVAFNTSRWWKQSHKVGYCIWFNTNSDLQFFRFFWGEYMSDMFVFGMVSIVFPFLRKIIGDPKCFCWKEITMRSFHGSLWAFPSRLKHGDSVIKGCMYLIL